MTTPPRLLADRVGTGPILIQRPDQTTYSEHDSDAVQLLIRAECVEGVGPKSGRIAFLRMTVSIEATACRIADLMRPRAIEMPGSVVSGASREVFRQPLRNEKGKGANWVWCHKRCA